jgi:hypothetical protein
MESTDVMQAGRAYSNLPNVERRMILTKNLKIETETLTLTLSRGERECRSTLAT